MAVRLFGKKTRALFEAVLVHVPVALIVVSADLVIVAISDFACRYLGLPRGELEGRPLSEVAAPYRLLKADGGEAALDQLPIVRACRSGEQVVDEQWIVEGRDGRREVVMVNAEPVRNARGAVIGAIASWTDITAFKDTEADLRSSLEIEGVLLREANHRIKNHLELVAALVRMEALNQGPDATRLARIVEDKLAVLAAAHEGFLSARSNGRISARALVQEIVKALETPYFPITAETADIELAAPQVTPVALILNEAISNALKHAFSEGRRGTIAVSLRQCDDCHLLLAVADDGTGLDGQPSDGLGLKIVGVLARQLAGTAALVNRPQGGALLTVEFPLG